MKVPSRLSRRVLFCVLALALGLPSFVRADDLVSLELAGGARFLVPAPSITEEAEGWSVTGTITLESPIGTMDITEAELFFAFAEGTSSEDRVFDRIVGRAQVPPPLTSDYVNIPSPCMAEIGYDYGRYIDLGVPLQDETHYLYFDFNAGLSVEFGATGDAEDTRPLTLDIPVGANATLILDVTDPFYFIDGGLSLPGRKKKDGGEETGEGSNTSERDGEEESRTTVDADDEERAADGENDENDENESIGGFGVGRSLMGRIPFRPTTTFGIEDKIAGFDGHRIEKGSFPLGSLPLEISGYVVTRLDPLDVENGVDPLGFGFGPSYAMGGNGQLSLGLSFLKVARLGNVLNFGFQLGEASVGVEVFGDRQRAYFSGVLDPDLSWVPDFMPIVPRGAVRASGYVGNDLLNTEVRLEGEFTVDLNGFSELSGVDAGAPLTVAGTLLINDDGFFLEGKLASDMPFVSFSSEARVAAFVSHDPARNWLLFEGLIDVGQVEVDGSVQFVPEGVLLGGAMTTEDLTLGLDGAIVDDQNGVSVLTGDLSYPDELQESFRRDLVALSDTIRSDMEAAVAEFEAATKDHEFELSLRGVRKVMPGICTAVINELNKVPGKVKSRWPKKWGVLLPGRSSAVKSAKKQIAPHISRFSHLRALSQKGDAESTRAALRAAFANVLKHRRCKVKVKRLGTVYNSDLLSGGRDAKVRAAMAAIDRLPETSSRKVAAARVVEEIRPREVVYEVADRIESGIEENVPTIEAIRFTNIREGEHKGDWIFEVDMRRGGETSTFTVEVRKGEALIPSITSGYVAHLAA